MIVYSQKALRIAQIFIDLGRFKERDEFLDIEAERNALMAERDRFWKALRSIAANTCCDKCREAALVARKALETT